MFDFLLDFARNYTDLLYLLSGLLWSFIFLKIQAQGKKPFADALKPIFLLSAGVDWLKMISLSEGHLAIFSAIQAILCLPLLFYFIKFRTDESSSFARKSFLLPAVLSLPFSECCFIVFAWSALIRLAAALFSYLIYSHSSDRLPDQELEENKKTRFLIFLSGLILLAMVAIGVIWLNTLAREEIKSNILLKAEGIASALDPEVIVGLPFEPRSIVDPDFMRIRRQLVEFAALFPDLRGIYSIKMVDRNLVFGPENYREDDPMVSPVGTQYLKPDERIFTVFENGKSIAIGPFRDEYGEFVSAFAPVVCPRNGSVLCVIGIDVDARVFNSLLFSSRLWFNIVAVLIFWIAGLTLTIVRQRRSLRDQDCSEFVHNVETFAVIALGVLFASVIFFVVAEFENSLHQNEQTRVSSLVFHRVQDSFYRLENHLEDLLVRAGGENLRHTTFQGLSKQCREEFPFAELILFDPQEPEKVSVEFLVQAKELLAQNNLSRNLFVDASSKLCVMLKVTDKQGKPIIGAYLISPDRFLAFNISGNTGKREGQNAFLYLLGEEKPMIGAMAKNLHPKLPPSFLLSRTRGLYFPLFIFDRTLVLRFLQPQTSLVYWRIKVPALAMAFACLFVFVVVSLMIRMTRNQNRLLEIQVEQRTCELQRSESRFRDLVESLSDWIWEVDLDGVYTYCYCSGVKEGMIGHDRMVGKKFYEIPSLVNKQAALDFLESFAENPRSFFDFENLYVLENGDKYYYSSSGVPLYDEKGKLIGFRGIARDITGKRVAEQELQKTRERYMLAVKGSRDGIWDWDIEKNQTFFSNRLKEMLGYRENELADSFAALISLIHPEEKSVFEKFLESYLHGETDEFSIEFRCRHKSGTFGWYQARGLALRDHSGKPYRMAGSLTDITARRDAEREIERTLLELEQVIDELHLANDRAEELRKSAEKASVAKSEFLANMSHEIRTPMNGVVGMVDLLLKTPLNEDQKRYAEVVKTSSEKLLAIINDILDFSKIEANRLDLEKVDFELLPVIDEVVDLFSLAASEKKIGLKVDADEKIPQVVVGDPNRLRQVLLNLLGNAVKFTETGSVTIKVTCEDYQKSKTKLRFAVIDTGVGIPEEAGKNLFSAFTQVDGSITRKFGGTGLGLAISRQLVELMGGHLAFTSKVGEGSEFFFQIPFRVVSKKQRSKPEQNNQQVENLPKETPRPMPTKDSPSQDKKALKALLVEDNETNQIVASTMIENLGFVVEIAGNGVDAVNMMLEKEFDMVFMDCQMPELDGFAATRMIRNSGLENNRRVPIVAMTASALAGDREKCLDAGMNDYIAKPFRIHELEEVIRRWVELETKDSISHLLGPEPSQADSEIFNYGDVLQRMMNNAQLAKTLIRSFVNETPSIILKIEKSFAEGNLTDAATFAHSIKGSAANIGAEKFSRQARQLEQRIKNKEPVDLSIELNLLNKTFAELLQKIENRRIL